MRMAEQVAMAEGRMRDSPEGLSRAVESPSAPLERDERCRQVRQALSQLPDEHRVVLVLREMEGYCYETIAEILEVPVGTVRSRLHRARMQLREELKEVLAIDE
jgi:RNA polymerase sigma-70 factor (ECF subfamily)